ncbi:MAG: DUF7665 family protein [Chloroflexota bacterium]
MASPDQEELRVFLESAEFLNGVDRARWALAKVDWSEDWPCVFIRVSAKVRAGFEQTDPSHYMFRFDCANYPIDAPTACPWDSATNAALDRSQWPAGGRVSTAFNPDWKPHALYLPCDREAMPGHEGWKTQFPDWWWTRSKNLGLYLRVIHELLHSADYSGPRSPAQPPSN